jgi:hypothetical protein
MRAAAAAIAAAPPLDELTRHRLVAGALDALDSSTHGRPDAPSASSDLVPNGSGRAAGRARARWYGVAGAAAAAIVLVSGVGLALRNDSGADDGVAGGAERTSVDAGSDLGIPPVDLGDVSAPDRLRGILGGDGELSSSGYDSTAKTQSAEVGSPTDDRVATESFDSTDRPEVAPDVASGAASTVDPECLAGLNPGHETPAVVGVATYEGRSAFVATVTESDRVLGWVVSLDDCTVLLAQQVAR